jgi:hypothetical protein
MRVDTFTVYGKAKPDTENIKVRSKVSDNGAFLNINHVTASEV